MCLLFNGIKTSLQQQELFTQKPAQIDYDEIDQLGVNLEMARRRHQHSRGWLGFSCDPRCQELKREADVLAGAYATRRAQAEKQMAGAKSVVGVFSEYGVSETRELFWEKFNQGVCSLVFLFACCRSYLYLFMY